MELTVQNCSEQFAALFSYVQKAKHGFGHLLLQLLLFKTIKSLPNGMMDTTISKMGRYKYLQIHYLVFIRQEKPTFVLQWQLLLLMGKYQLTLLFIN